MEGFKEFTGKSLDDAISQACSFFDTSRERLELDIIQDAKSGIFGLVGARKAIVRAKRVQLCTTMEDILGNDKKSSFIKSSEKNIEKSNVEKSKTEKTRSQRPKAIPEPRETSSSALKSAIHNSKDEVGFKNSNTKLNDEAQEKNENTEVSNTSKKSSFKPKDRRSNKTKPAKDKSFRNSNRRRDRENSDKTGNLRLDGQLQTKDLSKVSPTDTELDETQFINNIFDDTEDVENIRRIPISELDHDLLSQTTLQTVSLLTAYIVGDVPINIKIEEERILVHLDCDENSGLLIGREGQTLAALQYIISRIISRKMNATLRVQLDAGNYRTRQDEKLSDLAFVLAERVRNTGRPHSTRPLSSYHRRIVHMVLQDSKDIVTRSSGDGPLKRVIVQRKR